MKDKLKAILSSKVDPVFFVFSCLLLILFSVGAQLLVQDIANESDRGAEMFRLARVKQH
jgi:hypothetical protein